MALKSYTGSIAPEQSGEPQIRAVGPETPSITRRTLFGLSAGLAASAALGLPPAAAATRGGKMIFGRYQDAIYLDPAMTQINQEIWLLSNLFDNLVQLGADGKTVQPALATKWDFSADAKTVTFTLREGVKFADGSPLTAEDIKFTLDRTRDPKIGLWGSFLAAVDTIAVPDPGHLVLTLKTPMPALLPVLAMFACCTLPKNLIMAEPGATVEDKVKSFMAHPIGSGPFVLAEWQRNQVMRLKRNPYYWKQGEDGKSLPYIDELEFQIITDDSTRILKLQAGEIHGTELIPYPRVKELQGDPNLRVDLWPSTKRVFFVMNVRPTLKNGAPNPLGDVRVRRALNYAVNKEALIQITTQGLGTPMRSFLGSSVPLFYGPAQPYPYDLAKAKALLQEAGVANGLELTILTLAGSLDESSAAVAVQQMWAQVGVKLNIEQLDGATRGARWVANDFQLRFFGATDDVGDPTEAGSIAAYYPHNECRHSGWQDKRSDELFVQSDQEPDPAKRAAEYKEMQEVLNAAAPYLFLYEAPYPTAFRKNAKGFIQTPLGTNIFELAYLEP
ncbi:MAG TPA: ABC transporter substrate-binding protein [Stellaceae bacterium]|nr:ABC transporter substrate-binding protein [Stellaceae bacterium]